MSTGRDDSHWMERAFANARGQLREKTHTRKGRDISQAALHGAERSRSLKERREAQLAEEARRFGRGGHREHPGRGA